MRKWFKVSPTNRICCMVLFTSIPIASLYGIFTHIWLVNVGKYTIHGSYGFGWISMLNFHLSNFQSVSPRKLFFFWTQSHGGLVQMLFLFISGCFFRFHLTWPIFGSSSLAPERTAPFSWSWGFKCNGWRWSVHPGCIGDYLAHLRLALFPNSPWQLIVGFLFM